MPARWTGTTVGWGPAALLALAACPGALGARETLRLQNAREAALEAKGPTLGECGDMEVYKNKDTGLCSLWANVAKMRKGMLQDWQACSAATGPQADGTNGLQADVTTKTTFSVPMKWTAKLFFASTTMLWVLGLEDPEPTGRKGKMMNAYSPCPVELTQQKFRIAKPKGGTLVFTLAEASRTDFTDAVLACTNLFHYGLMPDTTEVQPVAAIGNEEQWLSGEDDEIALQADTTLPVASLMWAQVALRSIGEKKDAMKRQVVRLASQPGLGALGPLQAVYDKFKSQACPTAADCLGWILGAQSGDGAFSLALRRGFAASTAETIDGVMPTLKGEVANSYGDEERMAAAMEAQKAKDIAWKPRGWAVVDGGLLEFQSAEEEVLTLEGEKLSFNLKMAILRGPEAEWTPTPCRVSLEADFSQAKSLTFSILPPDNIDSFDLTDEKKGFIEEACNVDVALAGQDVPHFDLLGVTEKGD